MKETLQLVVSEEVIFGMPDLMLEPGRSPSGGVYRGGLNPLPLDSILPRPDLPEIEGKPDMESSQETGELSAGKPLQDKISEELQQALNEWALGPLKNMALEVQERLTEELLSWEPAPEKSAEDNLTEIRETVRRYSEALASRGGVLQITRPLEAALLEALSRWLEQMAAQLLRLLGPAGSPEGVEQLLNRLFQQITGTSPARGRTAARAAAVLREAAGRQPLQERNFP